jgi:hypothetical protein
MSDLHDIEDTPTILEKQRAANHEAASTLASVHQTGIDPLDVMWLRLNTMIEFGMGPEDASHMRQQFELQFERAIAEIIAKLTEGAARARLLAPLGGPIGPVK